MKVRLLFVIAALPVAGFLSGCSGREPRVALPEFDPAGISQRVMQDYDEDGDGLLHANELASAASLNSSLKRIDANDDGAIDASEIADRIRAWQKYGAGLMKARCTLVRAGRPVPHATITYVPEEFMGGVIHPASGVTDEAGQATLAVAEEYRPNPRLLGVQAGFYRVRVTLPSGEEDEVGGVAVAGDLLNNAQVSL